MPILLLGGLILILIGAELFTNAAEWLSRRLNLSSTVTGNILAAVGTALPESVIPIVALYRGGQMEIASGAVFGAPFMLGTLAFALCGLTAILCSRRVIKVDKKQFSFELSYILLMFAVFFISCLGGARLERTAAVFLLGAYGYYVWRMCRTKNVRSTEYLRPLYLSRNGARFWLIIMQLVLGLTMILGGAEFFILGIAEATEYFGVSALVLGLILAPIATELPEKFNSVIWILQGKDDLALGNITGALVFQCTVIPGLIMLKTTLDIDLAAIYSAVILVLSLGGIYLCGVRKDKVYAIALLGGFFWYGCFIALLFWSII